MEGHATHVSPVSVAINRNRGSSVRARASILRRTGLMWTLTLALAGWSVAGVAVLGDVQEHHVARRLAAAAGLTAISGPGIDIVLTDASGAFSSSADPSAALVQDGDVVSLNMMLWYGGAQAVAVNGARITAQSTIVSSGPTLVIDGRRMVGPFHVSAIGDPVVLRGTVEARGGVLDDLRRAGLGVRVTTSRAMVVPAGTSEQWGPVSLPPPWRL
jgi:hypothetical protein